MFLSAACVAAFCSLVMFALAADNGTLLFTRLQGALAVVAFAARIRCRNREGGAVRVGIRLREWRIEWTMSREVAVICHGRSEEVFVSTSPHFFNFKTILKLL